jgi:hypothetical protein
MLMELLEMMLMMLGVRLRLRQDVGILLRVHSLSRVRLGCFGWRSLLHRGACVRLMMRGLLKLGSATAGVALPMAIDSSRAQTVLRTSTRGTIQGWDIGVSGRAREIRY